ncbi:MAG: DoxX family protein [Chloroflexi bacterium]|nr:MAG: DoxX family protein [Chloroflexota bacterium]
MNVDLAIVVLRLAVAAIFIAQGWRKLLAPAEAPHGRANLQRMISSGGFPAAAPLAILVGLAELGGGTLVLAGLLTRLAVLPLIAILLVAIGRFKWKAGFLGGWDWPLAVLGACAALLLLGAGRLSLDHVLGVPGS